MSKKIIHYLCVSVIGLFSIIGLIALAILGSLFLKNGYRMRFNIDNFVWVLMAFPFQVFFAAYVLARIWEIFSKKSVDNSTDKTPSK